MSSLQVSSAIFFDEDIKLWTVKFSVTTGSQNPIRADVFIMETYCAGGSTIGSNVNSARFIRTLGKTELNSEYKTTSFTAEFSGYYQYSTSGFSSTYYTADGAISAYTATHAALKSLARDYPGSPAAALKVVPINLGTSSVRGRSSYSIDAYPGDIVGLHCTGGTGQYTVTNNSPTSLQVISPESNRQFRVITSTVGQYELRVDSGGDSKDILVNVLLPEVYTESMVIKVVS